MDKTAYELTRALVSGRLLAALAALVLALAAAASAQTAPGSSQDTPLVHVLAVDGAIGPATRDYVVRGIEKAESAGAALVVLQLDTPGGLDASMRDMIKKILNAEVPVATWVGPPGARAASAGTYIMYASHIAAMAESTNLGAATPVQIGGGGSGEQGDEQQQPEGAGSLEDLLSGDESGSEDSEQARNAKDKNANADGEEQGETDDPSGQAEGGDRQPAGDASTRKAVEDAVAYIRGLAEQHGRNADWAERAVRESVSLTSSKALDLNVIDLMADSIPELLEQIHGREIELAGGTVTLNTEDARIVEREPDWRSRFLSVLTNPTLAYILMMVGIYGLLLEGYNPGALVPGVIGGICLLLALYAFQILPVNYVGLALMLLGFALITIELFVPSIGILGIGGVAAVVVGSIILMDSEVPGMGINTGLIAAMGLASALVFGVIVYLAAKTFGRPRVIGREALTGSRAEAISNFSDGRGRVHLQGEDWSAASEHSITRGQTVEVVEVDGLVLQVRPLETSSQGVTP